DLLAEVLVGRIPASTATEVTNWVRKNLSYLQNNTVSSKKAGMIGQQLDEVSWGGDGKDDIVRRCFPADWEISRFYERDRTYSSENVISYLNSGPHLVNNFAHGNCNYAFGLDAADILALNNSSYFILYSQGCYESAFDNPYGYDSVGEYFVIAPNGAVAVVGNSRYGWYAPGAVIYGPSQVFDREFYNTLFNQNFTGLGESFFRSKANLAAGLGGFSRYVFYELNLFGDPALPVIQPAQGPKEELKGLVYFVKENNIWVTDLKAEETRQLTYLELAPGPGRLANLMLSDDGSKIIFAYRENTSSETNLYQVNSDGSGVENLSLTHNLNTLTKNQAYGVLSANGELLAFVAQNRSGGAPGGYQLWLKELTGSKRLFQLTFLNGNVSWPLFVEASRLLFLFSSSLDTSQDFYTITTTGSQLTNLTNNASVSPYFPRLGRPMLNQDRSQIIYGKQTQSVGIYSNWSLYTRSVLPGGPETQVLSGFYYSAEPVFQADPQPCFVGDSALIFRGERPYTTQRELFLTTFNATDPYLRSLPLTEEGSFPTYFVPPDNPTQVAYVSGGQIYVRRSDGTVKQLTSTVNENRDPVFSPTGEYIAYSGNGIWVMKADGSDPVQVEETFSARYPAFSPDGQWVVYIKDNDIYGRRLDRTNLPVRLTSTSHILKADVSFLPDGSRLIYTASTAVGNQIFSLRVTVLETTIRVDGSPINLTNTPGTDNYQARPSADSQSIVFISTRAQLPEIWLMDPTGQRQRKISFSTNPPVNPAWPHFSPADPEILSYLSGSPQKIWTTDLSALSAEGSLRQPEIGATQFSWQAAPAGTVWAYRFLTFDRIDPRRQLTYQIKLLVDALPAPTSVTLTEVLPAGWQLLNVKINGVSPWPLTSNQQTQGSLKWNFGLAGIAPLKDTVLELTVDLSSEIGVNAWRYLQGWVETTKGRVMTSGDAAMYLDNPYLPIDTDRDWCISNEELLRTIDLWATSSQKHGWPDVRDWDYWLLLIINFWINEAAGYQYLIPTDPYPVAEPPQWGLK
ncbi:MAG: C25 family cysteine peptidase, partial [Candidatus Omnitrophica bacterium]|nr:C25 family cysteine peptidase [Candidatus Omnitrophota bacterium]